MNNFKLRKIILIFADFLIIIASGIISEHVFSFLELENFANNQTAKHLFGLPFGITMNAVMCVFALHIFRAYSKMWRYSNKSDYLSCVFGTFLGFVISTSFQFSVESMPIPQYILINYSTSVIGIIFFRIAFKTAFLTLEDNYPVLPERRTLIVGAGEATRIILTELKNAQNDKDNKFKTIVPVCLVDDDPAKRNLTINNIKVVGKPDEIIKVCKVYDISLIIFCIPSCPRTRQKQILDLCSETGCEIRIVPSIRHLIFDEKHPKIINQIKNINIEDLLGREPITFDKSKTALLLRDKICMVTGGGGSIGSELVRQIANYYPKQIIIVDIYENTAYDIQQELFMEYGNDFPLLVAIASIRDYKKMEKIFAQYHPDLVFHAAAHKHVPLMETSPEEAVKNNILGTLNTAVLAEMYNAEKFLFISTDKAVNPTNVMGATKRCCEMIMQHKAQTSQKTEFITTRFGNVLGSNGSVIPLFKRQIESGKPVTVTHPEIIRYFMTIPEAVSLVLQAAAMAKGGEIFALDMGEPVKITTLAENLIKLYGKKPYVDVNIKFTGLRPGEKLFEELLMDEEGLKSTANEKIFIGNHINIDSIDFTSKLDKIISYAEDNNSEKVIEMLGELVPTFHHKA